MKKTSFLPNLFTALNLFAGFLAIVFSRQGKFEFALLSIVAGNIFDIADGRIARSLKSSSRFGVEFDSIADVVTFGVAPAFFLYEIYFKELEKVGIYFPFLFLLAIALRLARFNSENSKDRKYFHGLSSPLSALWLMTFSMLIYNHTMKDILIPVATVGISSLAISRLRFPSFKDVELGKNLLFFFIFFSVGIGLLLINPLFAILLGVSGYILWSILVENIIPSFRTKFSGSYEKEGKSLDIRHNVKGWRAGSRFYDDNTGEGENGTSSGTPERRYN